MVQKLGPCIENLCALCKSLCTLKNPVALTSQKRTKTEIEVDLKSGQPYYLIKSGLCEQYKNLQADAHTNVLILGGGISGALMAYELGQRGIECMVIDKRA